MKNYRAISLLFVTLFITGACFNLLRERDRQAADVKKILAACPVVLPQAKEFIKETAGVPHYKAFKTSSATANDLLGAAVVTTDIAPEIRGYAGAIKLLMGVDLQGNISRLSMISHSETPSYVLEMDSFLEQFKGLNIHNSFQLGRDIDGITRATISSEAVARAVEKSLKQTAAEALNLKVAGMTMEEKSIPLEQILIPLLLFAVAVTGVVTHKTVIRWSALLGGLVYLGILKSTMVSAVQIANICLLKFPAFHQSPLWYMLIGLTLITSVFWGMVFCGSLCPFATVQELLYNIAHRKNKKFSKSGLSRGLDQRGRDMKYAVLTLGLTASVILGNASAASMEPFLTLFTLKGTKLAWGLLTLTLVAAIFHFRFWCKYLCPVGACLGLITRISLFRIRLGQNCINCELCERACPTGAIQMNEQRLPVITHPECILCGKCIRYCPKETLNIRVFTKHAKGR